MPGFAKFLIGLVATVIMGWILHGPLGNGERYIAALQSQAHRVVADSGIQGVSVQLGRNPLSRVATLSGTADEFQRNGQGGQKGLTQMVEEIEGVSDVRWSDSAQASDLAMPLLVESLVAILLAYLLGIGLAWLLWRRRADRY